MIKFNNIGLDDLDLDPDADEDKKEKKKWFNRERLQALRSAVLLFLLDTGLPENQRWMFYTLLLKFHEDLGPPLYVWSLILILLMWYFPKFHPILVYAITTAVDLFRRKTTEEMYQSLVVSTLPGSAFSSLLRLTVSLEGTTELLEPIFGPANTWPLAIVPILPGLFFQLVEERDSINGFVPEGKQGILMAIFTRACAAVLPLWIQWPLLITYTAPDSHHPIMVMEWVLCNMAWVISGTSPRGAYALYLLVNQYPHPDAWFRHYGGGPSVVLERERRGTVWFIATSVIMQIFEVEAGSSIIESGSLDLSLQVWLPLALILAIGLYLLRYGLAIRIDRFKHQPLEKKDSIRLLRLRAQPCFPNSLVQCDMIHSTLKYPPPYIAISHRWEQPGVSQEIILIDGAPLLVSPNVHSFLRAKRSSLRHVVIWIDSICINQEDKRC